MKQISMYRSLSVVWFVLVSVAPISIVRAQGGTPSRPQAVEPVFVRAQQMVTAGQDSAGRAVVDSVLAATPEESPRYAEALFWRAALAKTAAAAERDYRRVSVEYPLSPRAQEALFRLAQLEMTRGDRVNARAHLERLVREHPAGPVSTSANVTLARLAFDDGDAVTACAAVTAARDGLTSADIELRNQLDYYARPCANVAARPASRDSSAATTGTQQPPASTEAAAATPPAGRSTSTEARREFSVQVAAYDTKASASALAKRLSDLGYLARVVGDDRPFRVRVGRYPSRERAADAVRQMSRQNVRGVIVEAEPR